jgi:hypothetical protein
MTDYKKYRIEYYDYIEDEQNFVNVVSLSEESAEVDFYSDFDKLNYDIRFIQEIND